MQKLQNVGKKTRKTNTKRNRFSETNTNKRRNICPAFVSANRQNSWLDVHEEYVNNVETQSRLSPENPICDVITLPIIFNEIIDCLALNSIRDSWRCHYLI